MSDPLAAIFSEYAALGRNRDKFALMLSPQTDDRQLEFYPPWERDNPQPGKATVQLFNQSEPADVTQRMIAGDMLHYMGAVDPRTGQVIDPTYFKLKQKLLNSRTPEQRRIDDRAYQRDLPYYKGEKPTKEDWMQFNRGDAYIRGYITPDEQDNWREMYTQEQRVLLDIMKQYLKRGSIAPGMNR